MPIATNLILPCILFGASLLLVFGMLYLHLKWLDRHHPNAELLMKFLQKLK